MKIIGKINEKWPSSNLINALILASLSLIISFFCTTPFYETTDDPLYRMISTGDFNSYVGPDSHVNFTYYLYLEFLIYLKEIINFNYFWDLCNYSLAFLGIFLLFYKLLELNNKNIKYLLIALAIIHFPSYFISFHLTKVSGLLVVSAFLAMIHLLRTEIKYNKSLYINISIVLVCIFLCSITRLKAPLLYLPTLIFCSIPILLTNNYSKLNKFVRLSFMAIFLILLSSFSVSLWNSNITFYSNSPIWKDFYSYNDNRYQLMEYNNFRDTKKYLNIFSNQIDIPSNLTEENKINLIVESYKHRQLTFYGSDKLKEICYKLGGKADDCSYSPDNRESLIDKILSLKINTLKTSDNNLSKEFLKYTYLEKIDSKMRDVGFSFNDYVVMEHWYFFDKKVFSKEKLATVVNNLNVNNFSKQFNQRLKYSLVNFDNSLKKQFPIGSTNLYLILSVLLIGVLGFLLTSNFKNISYSIYLVLSLIVYCTFIENYIKPLPNWIYFPTITILLISQIFYLSLGQTIKISAEKKQIALLLGLIFVALSSQVLVKDFNKSAATLKNRLVLESFIGHPRIADKIIVNVGAHIPAGDWCVPFQDCHIRKTTKVTGLGWTTQMGHDLIFYKENKIDNLALELVNDNRFLLAIDLYPLLENRLQKYYKEHYSCSVVFENYDFAPREEAGRYNLYTVKSSDNCEHKN